MNLRPLIFI